MSADQKALGFPARWPQHQSVYRCNGLLGGGSKPVWSKEDKTAT
jgi:hypothetical protein